MHWFFLHRWSKWSAVKPKNMLSFRRNGMVVPYVENIQFRTCRTCSKVQERTV